MLTTCMYGSVYRCGETLAHATFTQGMLTACMYGSVYRYGETLAHATFTQGMLTTCMYDSVYRCTCYLHTRNANNLYVWQCVQVWRNTCTCYLHTRNANNLYVWQCVQVWRNTCTCYFHTRNANNLYVWQCVQVWRNACTCYLHTKNANKQQTTVHVYWVKAWSRIWCCRLLEDAEKQAWVVFLSSSMAHTTSAGTCISPTQENGVWEGNTTVSCCFFFSFTYSMVNLQHDQIFHSFFVLKKTKQKQDCWSNPL